MIMRIIDTPSLEPFILKVIILKHNPSLGSYIGKVQFYFIREIF